ncbi:Putative LOC100646570, partial [Caligus rogercresseyi]
APLNLTMRLGDHMMLIQLQLSTVNAAASGANKRSRSSLDSNSSSNNSNTTSTTGSSSSSNGSYRPKLDTRALAEASKNLTQTLKQLSSEVLTKKPSSGTSESSNQSD